MVYVVGGTCTPAAGQTCDYTWLDPVTEPRGALNIPMYDLFLAVQDRAFNDDGSINFSNGLGQPIPLAPPPPGGYTPITNGVNPLVHPTWVPEYFGDHSVVNGTLAELKKLLPPAEKQYIEKQPSLEDVFFAVTGKKEAA